jgi:hypothetical protein
MIPLFIYLTSIQGKDIPVNTAYIEAIIPETGDSAENCCTMIKLNSGGVIYVKEPVGVITDRIDAMTQDAMNNFWNTASQFIK